MRWLNEPPSWSLDGDILLARTAPATDFWRETFYGFVRDTGHAFLGEVRGDFTAEAVIGGAYEALYDQSGLMLRVDETRWVKAGIEFTDGLRHASAVVTNGRSDWSVVPLPEEGRSLRVRLTRHGEAVRVQFLRPDGAWQLLRLAYLDMPERCEIGVMCCSPQGGGFEARFEAFTIGEPVARELHG